MDNGMDIDARYTLLAYHAALAGDFRAWFKHDASRSANTSLPDLVAFLRSGPVVPRRDLADRALAWEAQPGRRILYLPDIDYPPQLRTIAQPPPVLFVAGVVDTLMHPQIAIVGSRKATATGLDIASRFASELAESGIVTTSGMAQGIDAAAHRGAISRGLTVAVLGSGIDRLYPARHRTLASEITERGALISEFPLGTAPFPQNFPRRNRVISALSLGTVVVEAALRSGSISTAFHALEQGREVFAVPGSINNPLARGCHALIKQGAKLVEAVSDILEEFTELPGINSSAADSSAAVALSKDEAVVLEACGWDPFTVDNLVDITGLTVPEVSAMLLRLELAGFIQPQATGTIVRVR
jgi:DNA processing protein